LEHTDAVPNKKKALMTKRPGVSSLFRRKVRSNRVALDSCEHNGRAKQLLGWRRVGAVFGLIQSCLVLGASGTTTYTYDEAGRLKQAVYQDTSSRTYTLDAAGNRTATSQSTGNGLLTLSVSITVNEPAGSLSVTVTRTGPSAGVVGVSYATSNGTATAGSDYTATSGTLSWPNGDSANKSFSIPITNDSATEGNETFAVTLSVPTGGAVLAAPSAVVVTVVDDEDANAPSAPGIPSFSSITDVSATANWTAASDNVAVTGYRYRLNGGAWNTLGNVLTVGLTGLTPVTNYTFDVQARDAAANWGASASNSFTTQNTVPPPEDYLSLTVGYDYWDSGTGLWYICYGYESGDIGSLSPNTLIGGRQVLGFEDCSGGGPYGGGLSVTASSDPGAGWVSWVTVNGVTFYPNYYFYGGQGYAIWYFSNFGLQYQWNATIPVSVMHQ
jgi:YD repeat-containing protein